MRTHVQSNRPVSDPVVTIGDEGHGKMTCDPQTPVGTGTAHVEFNFSEGGGPTRTGTPFNIIVTSGETVTADARRSA